MTTLYLSLGSNHGDRHAHLAAALAALPALGVEVTAVSEWISTRPVAMASRAPFLNGVVAARTALPPRVLLRRLLRLEAQLGRHRASGGRKTPRVVDIDVLFYGGWRIRAARVAVPHPRFAQRGFVLRGLSQLAPHGHAPGSPAHFRQQLTRLPYPRATRA